MENKINFHMSEHFSLKKPRLIHISFSKPMGHKRMVSRVLMKILSIEGKSCWRFYRFRQISSWSSFRFNQNPVECPLNSCKYPVVGPFDSIKILLYVLSIQANILLKVISMQANILLKVRSFSNKILLKVLSKNQKSCLRSFWFNQDSVKRPYAPQQVITAWKVFIVYLWLRKVAAIRHKKKYIFEMMILFYCDCLCGKYNRLIVLERK